MAKKTKKKKVIFQNHHIIYENEEKRVRAVTCRIRKGVHMAITILRRFTYLTDQEINTIKLESELKRQYSKHE